MRYEQPSPYEEISHTADAGIVATGQDPQEACARAVLAMAQLQAGGGPIGQEEERSLEASGEDWATLLVDFARQVLNRFYDERLLLGAVEIEQLSEKALKARGWFGRFDPDRHAEGMDVKAVTYASAGLERMPDGRYAATLIFDI